MMNQNLSRMDEPKKREFKSLIKVKAGQERAYPSKLNYKITLAMIFLSTIFMFFQYGFVNAFLFIIVGYFNHQFTFMIYHSRIHVNFQEKDFSNLHLREYIAWIHHYIDPKYLVCEEHYRAYLHWKFTLFFPLPTAFILYISGFGDYNLGVIGSWLLWQTTLAPIHTWYHVKPKLRKRYFSTLEYSWLWIFEKIGLISTRKHSLHHRHGLGDLENADNFQDAWMPFFIVRGYNKFFKWVQTLYIEGQTKMRRFLRHVILINYIITHLLFAYLAKGFIHF
jgi:hypothetical protein